MTKLRLSRLKWNKKCRKKLKNKFNNREKIYSISLKLNLPIRWSRKSINRVLQLEWLHLWVMQRYRLNQLSNLLILVPTIELHRSGKWFKLTEIPCRLQRDIQIQQMHKLLLLDHRCEWVLKKVELNLRIRNYLRYHQGRWLITNLNTR